MQRRPHEKILVTSALPYVNNVPHMGNIIGCVLSADVFARFKRAQGNDVLYVCGTDEHGTTTEAKAREEGLTPRQVCDKYYKVHKEVYDWFDISFDIFGRTSEENHHRIVREIFTKLQENGYVLEREEEHLFDETEWTFLADRFVEGTCPHCGYEHARGDQCESCGKLLNPDELKDPKSKLSGTVPIKKKSTHLYLDLQKLQPDLQKWFADRAVQGQWTQNALTTTKAWLDRGLEPRAITRDLEWGVPVPGHDGKVFYVWFDAPIGYISITDQMDGVDYKDWWNRPDVKLYQFMAKDNIPFHTILFPATLIGTKDKWTLLYHINATEYLQHEDGKFSKSRGTGLFGDDAMKTGLPSDIYRYYLLVNRPEKADTMFAWKDLQEKVNNELLANLGNLINRTLQFIKKYHEGRIKESILSEKSANFLEWVHEEAVEVTHDLEWAKEKDALRRIMRISNKANTYFQEEQPWKTRTENEKRCHETMYVLANVIKDMGIMLEPFMPHTSKRIFDQLHLERPDWWDIGELSIGNHSIGEPQTLFDRIENEDIERIRNGLEIAPEQTLPELQVRVGRIVECYRHPDADKLLIEKVDFGGEIRQIVSGLVGHYPQEELRGKTALFVTNLETAMFRGEKSEGMILAAQGETPAGEEKIEVLFADAPAGTLVLGTEDDDTIALKQFQEHTLEVQEGKVLVNGNQLNVNGKEVTLEVIRKGTVR